jgi:hypothetical protein
VYFRPAPALQEPWTMMRSISVTEYLNYEDGKVGLAGSIAEAGSHAWHRFIALGR